MKDELHQLAPHAREEILDGIVEAQHLLPEFDINTPLRLCHFLAQCAHESDGFRTTEEYASGEAYEGRESLGNIKPGDGRRFKGRGLIQTTGRHNYQRFTIWIQVRREDAPNFIQLPQQLSLFPWALLSALFYWNDNNINRFADMDDLRGATKAVNGGLNGFLERGRYLNRAKSIWMKPEPTLQEGMAGGLVQQMQIELNQSWPRVEVDGAFGPQTMEAVKLFQRAHGLNPDGIVGPMTWAKLKGA